MPVLTFPDGNTREVAAGTTGRSVVEGITKSLAKRTVAMALDVRLTAMPVAVEQAAGR